MTPILCGWGDNKRAWLCWKAVLISKIYSEQKPSNYLKSHFCGVGGTIFWYISKQLEVPTSLCGYRCKKLFCGETYQGSLRPKSILFFRPDIELWNNRKQAHSNCVCFAYLVETESFVESFAPSVSRILEYAKWWGNVVSKTMRLPFLVPLLFLSIDLRSTHEVVDLPISLPVLEDDICEECLLKILLGSYARHVYLLCAPDSVFCPTNVLNNLRYTSWMLFRQKVFIQDSRGTDFFVIAGDNATHILSFLEEHRYVCETGGKFVLTFPSPASGDLSGLHHLCLLYTSPSPRD